MTNFARTVAWRSTGWLLGLALIGFSIAQMLLPSPVAESVGVRMLLYLVQYGLVLLGPLAAALTLTQYLDTAEMLLWAVVAAVCIAGWRYAFRTPAPAFLVPAAAGVWVVAGTVAAILGLGAGA
jgi:hypothetical protein